MRRHRRIVTELYYVVTGPEHPCNLAAPDARLGGVKTSKRGTVRRVSTRWSSQKTLARVPMLAATMALVLAGCGMFGSTDAQTGSSSVPHASNSDSASAAGGLVIQLAGRTFLSTSITGRELVSGSTILITFPGDGTVEASPGCNRLSGKAIWDDNVLSVTDLMMTERGCEGPLDDQDHWFAGLLTTGVTISLAEDRLTLTTDDVTLEFLDRRSADQDLSPASTN